MRISTHEHLLELLDDVVASSSRGDRTAAGADEFWAGLLTRRSAEPQHPAELTGLSLSVEPENYAIALYRNEGFIVVGSNGGAVTMLLDLPDLNGAE